MHSTQFVNILKCMYDFINIIDWLLSSIILSIFLIKDKPFLIILSHTHRIHTVSSLSPLCFESSWPQRAPLHIIQMTQLDSVRVCNEPVVDNLSHGEVSKQTNKQTRNSVESVSNHRFSRSAASTDLGQKPDSDTLVCRDWEISYLAWWPACAAGITDTPVIRL